MMIKFFRRIRQTLVSENKFSKYLIYALGEILLVVIGILIALQINNWNEAKKTDRSERVFLTQMLNSLKSDLSRTKSIYNDRALRKERAIKTFMNDINSATLPPDSILYPSFGQMRLTLSFFYDKGAYESLKSHGLETIKNDSLRQNIVRTYENDLPLGIWFINQNRDLQNELREKYILELSEYGYRQAANGQWEDYWQVDFKKIKNSLVLKNLFRLERQVASNYISRLQRAILDFEELIADIQNELEKPK